MSALYNLEPQPTAKVILKTTSGDLSLELFAKQTPLASRNFLQHCLDGYYNGTIFHRLVAGFVIQGGDPTGTGSGGQSAINDGQGFEDEFHSRLKFNRRGLLGMAKSEGEGYGSQFFLTLGETRELQGVMTMFGRIEGDTIYNLMKMAEAELVEGESSERPLYPTRITGAEILVNPFEDMVARAREAPRVKDEARQEVKKRKKPAGKNVLSFGGEEEGDAMPVLKKVKANPKLVSAGQEEPAELNNTKMPVATASKPRRKKETEDSPVAAENDVEMISKPAAKPLPVRKPTEDEDDDDEEDERDQRRQKTSALERTNAEIAALKASMKRTVDTAPKEKEKPKNALEAMIPATSTRGRRRGKMTDEKGAIDLFKAFKQRLEDLPSSSAESLTATNGKPDPVPVQSDGIHANPEPTTADDEEAELCDLHFIANCQSCQSWTESGKPDAEVEADGEDDPAWMAHTLTFAKDTLGKDLEWRKKMEEIEVIDPREKARAIKDERKKSGKSKR